MRLPDRFYVTGTDTGVGKTLVSALLCAVGGYDYWKPVQAGLEEETDTEAVARRAGVRCWPEAFRLRRPASPHAAADDEGLRVEVPSLPPAPRLLVEGAGGWMVPFAAGPEPLWQSALPRAWGLPVLVVARSGLGTLNHTFLTLRALAADGLPCLGVVMVGPPHPDNERDVPLLGGAPLLGRVPHVADPEAAFPELARGLAAALETA